MTKLVDHLRGSELFSDVPADVLREIVPRMTEVDYRPGEWVFESGDRGDAAFIVLEGRLALVADGVTVVTRRPGEFVGEFALIDEQPRSAGARAETAVRLLRWERGEFEHTIAEHPEVARGIFRTLTGKLRQDVASSVSLRLEQARWAQDLARAREIQRGMIPRDAMHVRGVEIASHFEPASAVGGDFFDYLPLAGGRLGVIIADVTGHGFYSSLFVAMTKSCLHTQARFGDDPAEIMAAVRRTMDLSLGPLLLMTCFYGVFDPAAGELSYANAGHPYPLHYRRDDRRVAFLEAEDPVLGALDPDHGPYAVRRVPWRAGDVLVLYSDGLTEARDARGRMLEVAPVAAALRASAERSAAETRRSILDLVVAHAGRSGIGDDLTVVVAMGLAEATAGDATGYAT